MKKNTDVLETSTQNNKSIKKWHVSWLIIRASLMSFGGGNAVIPVLYRDLVEKYSLITAEHFFEVIGIANILPGPSLLQMSVAFAYKLCGSIFVIVVMIGIMLPIPILFAVCSIVLQQYIAPELFQTIAAFVMPVIFAIILELIIKMYKKSRQQIPILLLLLLIFVSILFLLFFPALPPAVIIVIGMLLAVILYKLPDVHKPQKSML